MDIYRLYEVTPAAGGIFTALQTLDVPWQESNISSMLDMEYYGNVSGEKIVSPLVRKKLSDGELSAADQLAIATSIFAIYGTNWAKEWATLSEIYDPIANYDMEEKLTNDITQMAHGKTHTRTDNTTEQRTDNLSHGKTGTETQTPLVTKQTNDSTYGFNSSTAVPSGSRSESSGGTDTMTYNTTETDTGTSTMHNTGTVTDADTGTDTNTRNYTLTRKGNIGVTTSQQLLQSERDLWKWVFFNDVVFPDIDRVMTIQTY